MSNSVITRFAPSPTGYLHLGNLRAALWNYCFAKQNGGQFILRIEDTDLARSRSDYAQSIIDELGHFGLYPDQIYYQSLRTELYQEAVQSLLDQNLAYPCFCTTEDLEAQRQTQIAAKQSPAYDGTCQNLSESEVQHKKSTLPYCVRLRMPNKPLKMHDLVYGKRNLPAPKGDFVIQRSDKSFAFLLTNLIDDLDLGVTHVLRGADHLTNTERQFCLQQALNSSKPLSYGHLPLIHGADQKPLSKRFRHAQVRHLTEDGFLPDAILNYLMHLGHTLDAKEPLPLNQLVERFDLAKVIRSCATYAEAQMLHWQRNCLASNSLQQRVAWAEPALQAHLKDHELPSQAVQWLAESSYDYPTLQALAKGCLPDTDFSDEAIAWIQDAPASLWGALSQELKAQTPWADLLQHLKDQTSLSGKALMMPLRAALTTQTQGGPLGQFIDFMPPALLQKRLDQALVIGHASSTLSS